jgi:hypothetical protein
LLRALWHTSHTNCISGAPKPFQFYTATLQIQYDNSLVSSLRSTIFSVPTSVMETLEVESSEEGSGDTHIGSPADGRSLFSNAPNPSLLLGRDELDGHLYGPRSIQGSCEGCSTDGSQVLYEVQSLRFILTIV